MTSPAYTIQQIETAILALPKWLFDGTRGRGLSTEDTQTDHRVRAMQLVVMALQGQSPVRMVKDEPRLDAMDEVVKETEKLNLYPWQDDGPKAA